MMKKLLFPVCMAVVLAILLGACAADGMDISGLEKSEYSAADQNREVVMTPEKPSISIGTKTLKLHFANSSDNEYTFGMEPCLEVESGGVWYAAPTVEGAVWIEIAYVLPANGETDLEFPLDIFYGSLPAGHYRIVKPLYTQAGSTFVIAEFTIK